MAVDALLENSLLSGIRDKVQAFLPDDVSDFEPVDLRVVDGAASEELEHSKHNKLTNLFTPDGVIVEVRVDAYIRIEDVMAYAVHQGGDAQWFSTSEVNFQRVR